MEKSDILAIFGQEPQIAQKLDFQDQNVSEILHFGIDTIRFNFVPKFEGHYFKFLFEGLSLNSNINNNVRFFDLPVQIQYSQTENKKVLNLSYFGDSIICIEWILDGGAAMERSFVVIFYSAYFYIPEIKSLLKDFVIKYSSQMKLSRLDICMDLRCTVNQLWDCHRTKAQKKSIIKNGDKIQTFYLGSKVRNDRHYIRVYDKKLDSSKKGKFHLFMDYFLEPHVARIELQINSVSIRTFDLEPLHIIDDRPMKETYLWKVFQRACFNESVTNFDIVPVEKTKQKLVNTKWDRDFLVLDELPYAAVMLGYAKRLKEKGFDVISYLQRKLNDID